MSEPVDLLIVEDSEPLSLTYAEFARSEFRVATAHDLASARSILSDGRPPLVLLDVQLPDGSGLDLLADIRAEGTETGVIVITGDDSAEIAVEALRLGADDFLEKPVSPERLRTTLRNTIEKRQLKDLVSHYQKQTGREEFEGFIGASLMMQGIYHMVEAAAPSKATVFITGESGTGKEVLARAIHRCSPRANHSFVALNCGAIPGELMESEIFGHVKGAFTGALADRNGAAYEANGGTLFLDEICEMSPDVQAKLLRFIQTGTFRKIGSTETETVDIRFVSATNRDPLAEVAAGRFREDLYYRLHVVPLELPALRDREDDLMLVANHFLQLYATEEGKDLRKFSGRARELLLQYRWPGNVRELQNVIRNVVVLNSGHEVTPKMLPTHMSERADDQPPIVNADSAMAMNPMPSTSHTVSDRTLTTIRRLDEVEREYIEYVIQTCDNNVPRAAAMLGVSPSTIYRKLQNWAA